MMRGETTSMCVKIRFSALSGATVLGFGCICVHQTFIMTMETSLVIQ